jgi:hypothetical protein
MDVGPGRVGPEGHHPMVFPAAWRIFPGMKTHFALAGATGLLLIATLAGCSSSDTGYYRDRPIGYDSRTTVVYEEDDYDYYPGYEVYYARNRREYVYRDGNRWVRSATYPRANSQILFSSPSVRVEFRDSPERHHDTVVRRYPRDWRRDRDGDGRRDWRDENRNGINDYDEVRRREWRDDNRNGINDYDEIGRR